MTIDLSDLIDALAPDPIAVKIGDSSFAASDLTVGEVMMLATVFAQLKNEVDLNAAISFMTSLFKNEPPPQLAALKASLDAGELEPFEARQKLIKQNVLIANAILIACNEVAGPKKLELATDAIRCQLAATEILDG